MINTLDTSLLNNNNDVPNRYGTFSETSSATTALQKSLSRNHTRLECGQKCFRNPIAGCATFCGTISCPTTLVVKNDASTARDNCSIERNFLSWLRFSLALVLVGMSYYLRFEIISPALPSENEENVEGDYFSTILGLFFIFLGSLVLIWALVNYFQFQQMLAKRYTTVQHDGFHFSVAAFIGLTIFMACIFNILNEEKERQK